VANHRNYRNTFSNSVKWHRDLRVAVYKRDLFTCKHCGKMPPKCPIDYDGRYACCDLVIDHIVPAIKGGELTFENTQALCGTCNAKKGSK